MISKLCHDFRLNESASEHNTQEGGGGGDVTDRLGQYTKVQGGEGGQRSEEGGGMERGQKAGVGGEEEVHRARSGSDYKRLNDPCNRRGREDGLVGQKY